MPTHTVTLHDGSVTESFDVPHGMDLRAALIAHGQSPHGAISARLNCGGRGHCALCTVRVDAGAPPPAQWLDALSSRLGLRIACQVEVDRDLTVRL